MADKVEVKFPNGKWVERTAKNISEEELAYEMRCCGTDKSGNNLCRVGMIPVRRTKPKPSIHFRQKNGECIHIFECSCDKQRKYRLDTHSDRQAIEYEPEGLWDAMIKKEKKNGQNKGKTKKKDNGSNTEDDNSGGAEPKERKIRRKYAVPKTPQSLAATLLNLTIDKIFANTKVEDLIIDYRTLARYRRNGIMEGSYTLVFAKRLAPANRIFTANEDEIVLVDCKYNASKEAEPHGCMQFRMTLDRKAMNKMRRFLRMKEKDVIIVIFSRWEKDPDNENTYFAIDADRDHIGCIRLPAFDEN